MRLAAPAVLDTARAGFSCGRSRPRRRASRSTAASRRARDSDLRSDSCLVARRRRPAVSDSIAAAMPAFFPRAAYVQVKQIANPSSDYRFRLLAAYRADIRAAHQLLGSGAASATLLYVSVPKEWAWIPPGYCFNRIGY